MKTFLVFTCCLLHFSFSFSQHQLDLYTQRMLQHASPEKTDIALFVKGEKDAIKEAVSSAKGIYKFGYGELHAVEIPLVSVNSFLKNSAIAGVESGEIPMVPLMDTAIIVNQIQQVHQGIPPLSQAFKGAGVIMGIIDFGIDFNHPDFKNSNGDTRVRYLWDQNAANVNSPAPYNYGRECSEFQINAGNCPHTENPLTTVGHGTTVSGIAAGNGSGCDKFTGVAPESDIIVVAFNFNRPFLSTFVDAVDYIFKKADAMGKPCVINASIGTYAGSRDGIDFATQMVEAMLEERNGRALVCAAGNAGNVAYHLGYEVAVDTQFTWFRRNPQFNDVFFQLWADTADFMDVWFSIGWDNQPNYTQSDAMAFVNLKQTFGLGVTTNSISQNISLANTSTIKINAQITEGRYFMEIQVLPFNSSHFWRFSTTGSGKFDIWSHSFFEFSDMVTAIPDSSVYPAIVNYVKPDTRKTIVSSYATSDKVITVGNYSNRSTYIDVDGCMVNTGETPGLIFNSSSRGPTRDNRIKPDVVATGSTTIATGNIAQVNIFMGIGTSSCSGNRGERLKVGNCPANRNYMRNGGTSMASPIAAGIAALYFEKKPDADWREIKDALILSARVDSFTGEVPNNTYGFGKVSGFEALQLELLYGCTDSTALNYNPAANMENGSCIAIVEGCINPIAENFDSLANVDDGSCIITGCTDSLALNYNPEANEDDGSCINDTVSVFELNQSNIPELIFMPNFFRENTLIVYDLKNAASAFNSLTITNLLGQKVDVLRLEHSQGTIAYSFPSKEAGVYFYHLAQENKILLSGKIMVY